jgi:hypothetical protein
VCQHPKEANMSPQDVAPYFQSGSPTCPFPEGTLVGAPGVAQGGNMDAEVWLDVSAALLSLFAFVGSLWLNPRMPNSNGSKHVVRDAGLISCPCIGMEPIGSR